MKKTLIALAVAGVVAAPAAFAATSNVDIYGIIDASANSVDVDYDGSKVVDNWMVGNVGNIDASRIGIKGTEDLGGGLKAIWQVESKLNVDAETSLGGRNTFVGVSGGFGTVLLGRHDTPEKLSTAKLDLFADSVGDYNFAGTIIDTRETNVIAYISPTFSGFHAAVAAVAGEQATGPNDGLADHYSMAAMYENGPIYLGAGYTSVKAGYSVSLDDLMGVQTNTGVTVTTDDVKMYRLGAGYTMGNLKLVGVYQNVDIDGAGGDIEDGFTLGAAYGMGNITLKAQYNKREDLLKGYTFGADYNMSKRTKAYAVYTKQSEDGNDVIDDLNAKILSVGLRHSF
jgi:predicted porin